ncbi:hypothetical protein [Mesoterricola sediminis]|uniref:Lipoprotein n=1 Tax=Mesoterricola sediminis TaxID=2927980 RepID=A0AA48GZX4_9BACT|nr:hypothetical protein [Mesoterricola sediminis]BDU78700.1 hypothetical protein METESE_36580 [Mesoterricola sediminis]
MGAIRGVAWMLAALLCLAGTRAGAQERRAEGVTGLKAGATILVMPLDVELYALTAGGVREPKAEWTEKARTNLLEALRGRERPGGLRFIPFEGPADETVAELGHLNAAVAEAIWWHHFGPMHLPAKRGQLDWTLGEEAAALAKATPADYALYLFLRDSTATGGRVATIALMAVAGLNVGGGSQVGYADLVDLRTGQVVWFNRLVRMSGDVREPAAAKATLDNLLAEFPE